MDREIEDILKAMPVRKPSAALDQRVLEATRKPARRSWRLVGVLGTASAAAALIALAVLLRLGLPGGAPGPDPDGAIAFERSDLEVFQLTDEGVIFLDEHLPVRQIRRSAFHRVMLIDDERDIRFEHTVPQEDLLLIPVQYD